MIKNHKNEMPLSMQDHIKWQTGRRSFLKTLMVGAALSQIPWWVSCTSNSNPQNLFVLNPQEIAILKIVQNFLFPNDGNGPGCEDIHAQEYLQWVLLDPVMDPEEKKYIIHGIAWVAETAQEEMQTDFLKLTAHKQQSILSYITTQDWGESWYSVLLTFIFEALLSDPVYDANPDGIGWKWLHHNPGNPRPDENLKYGHFTTYVNRQTHS